MRRYTWDSSGSRMTTVHRTEYHGEESCPERESWEFADILFWMFSWGLISTCMWGNHLRLEKKTAGRIRGNSALNTVSGIVFVSHSQGRNFITNRAWVRVLEGYWISSGKKLTLDWKRLSPTDLHNQKCYRKSFKQKENDTRWKPRPTQRNK